MPPLINPFTNPIIHPYRSPLVKRGQEEGSGEWTPDELFTGSEVGDYWDATSTTYLYQDTLKTTPVTSNGDVVGCLAGVRGAYDFTQGTTSQKPIYINSISRPGIRMFTGGTRHHMLTTLAAGTYSNVTLALSIEGIDDVNSFAQLLMELGTSSSNRMNVFRRSTGTPTTKVCGTSLLISGSNATNNGLTIDNGEEGEIIGRMDASGQLLYEDTSNDTTTNRDSVATAAGAAWGNVLAIGRNIANSSVYCESYIKRGCFLNRTINDAETDNLLTWLAGSAS